MIKNRQPADLLFIQITDLHLFTNKHGKFCQVNSYLSLQAILQHIQGHYSDCDAILVTGDLVQETAPESYQLLLELLEKMSSPIYCLPGNHDSPDLMKTFLNKDDIHTERQTGFDCWDIFFLNTFKQSSHSGYLPQEELEALDHSLTLSTGSHALICLHHHPVPIGSTWMDSMILENPDELFTVLDKYDHIRGIIWGHIHQEFSTLRNDVILLGTPSTCAQFSPEATEYQQDINNLPGYRWLLLKENGKIETGIVRVPHDQETT